MSKARDLADSVSTGGILEDGAVSVSEISDLTVTAAELNNVAGVNSDVQTQLDLKAPLASPTFTGAVSVEGSLNTGTALSTGDAQIEVGVGRTDDGNAYVDLHAESGADYSGRILRTSGANGALSFTNKGSGTTSIGVEGAGIVITKTNDTERTRITSDGKFGVGTTAPATMIESVGTASINPLQLSAPKEIFTRIRRTDAGADANYIGNFIFTAKNDASAEKEYAKILVQQTNVEAGNEDGTFVIQAAKDGSLFSAVVVDGNGDLLSLRTSSGEKFRIASSGQLGIGGANYGTAGQVLTSGGSGAAPTWADAAGGGTVELTAASDISVGDRIRIKTSTGEVEPIQYRNISDDGDTQINASVSNNDRFTGAAYVGNNKYVAIYGNNSDSDYPYYNVITVASDGTYTIGTSTRIGTFTCFPVGSIAYHRFHVASDGDGEVVLYFEDGTSSGLKTITGTVSGSSITWGSVQTVESTNPFAGDICYDSTNNLYFLLYTDSAGASKVKTASSNGSNTLTFSSATTWYYPATATKYMSATYNVDQGNVEVYYSDKDDQNNVKGRTLTYSGGSITVSSAVQIDYIGTENQDGVYANYVPEQGYTVVMSMQTSPSRSFSILVVSNSSGALTLEYTYNAQHSFNSDTHYNTFYDPVSESQLFLYSDGSGTCYLKQYTWDTSTASKISLETDINLFSSDRMMGGNGFYDANSGTTFLIFSKGPSYGATPTITKFTTKIAKVSDFIGFADEAISAGSAGKITTVGGLTTNQSGLSAGSVYYINTTTGALTASSSGSVKIGKALSSTSILVQSIV